MSRLSQQFHALRTPNEYKISRDDELHHHITQNIKPFLGSTPLNTLAHGDDKAIADPLEVLSPAEDTLPYLYVLLAQIDDTIRRWKEKLLPKALEPGGPLWQKMAFFLDNFDPVEIRYAGPKWLELMNMFDRASQFGKTIPIMEPMAQAILRLDPSAGTFTSTHLLFVKLCLRTQSFQEARIILDRDIYSLPPQESFYGFPCSTHHLSTGYITIPSKLSDKVTLTDILQYYLLGAMIYISLHDWTRASYFLENILSTPTNNTANGLMLEAYKKWVLVGLLANGQMSSMPTPANGQAIRPIRQASKAYESIAEAFKSTDPAKLHAEANEGHAIWQEDANEGLIRQVLEHHHRLSVVRLGKVYAVVPISKIARKLGSTSMEAEAYIGRLIDQGLLKATLDRPTNPSNESIVRFSQNTNHAVISKSEEQMRYELTEQTKQIKALGDHIKEADRRLSLSKEYLDHVRRTRKGIHDRHSPEHEGMDMSFHPGPGSDEEENVMTDVG